MGVFCIILGSILAAACCAGGVFLGYLMNNYNILGQLLYQFVGLPNSLIAWLVGIGAGLVLALILGLPLIAGGNMYCKGVRALRKARKYAKNAK